MPLWRAVCPLAAQVAVALLLPPAASVPNNLAADADARRPALSANSATVSSAFARKTVFGTDNGSCLAAKSASNIAVASAICFTTVLCGPAACKEMSSTTFLARTTGKWAITFLQGPPRKQLCHRGCAGATCNDLFPTPGRPGRRRLGMKSPCPLRRERKSSGATSC